MLVKLAVLREEVMHEPMKEGLEDYLRGRASARTSAHLDACRECREEAERMREQAAMIRLLRVDEEACPAPGFFGRVMARVETQYRPSVWSVFLEPVFGRRLMYASLTLVILLGTFLVSTESGEPMAASTPAEQYLVEENPPVGSNPQQARDVVLVRLATFYE